MLLALEAVGINLSLQQLENLTRGPKPQCNMLSKCLVDTFIPTTTSYIPQQMKLLNAAMILQRFIPLSCCNKRSQTCPEAGWPMYTISWDPTHPVVLAIGGPCASQWFCPNSQKASTN